ncbi:uncharacterized protein LOC110188370 [Drosophila serrata]|uniref:uncharacterized protein LOC110188370 n=1 Tax=Drosophila serrata TaxID=7274 RepID=UPI000A1D0847|nr:uncharacterized protein LOC110188370 [Drosophila serrata]
MTTTETEDVDTFLDCLSDDEEVEKKEVASPELTVGHGDEVVCKQARRYDDPVEIRAVLERAAIATQRMLRCYGGTDGGPTLPSRSRFYPATLEVSARLHTDDKCPCPKDRQCKLRGDPVTLNLPIELNPESGQVRVNIFQPKAMGTICGCDESGDRTKTKKRASNRSVRWCSQELLCPGCQERTCSCDRFPKKSS